MTTGRRGRGRVGFADAEPRIEHRCAWSEGVRASAPAVGRRSRARAKPGWRAPGQVRRMPPEPGSRRTRGAVARPKGPRTPRTPCASALQCGASHFAMPAGSLDRAECNIWGCRLHYPAQAQVIRATTSSGQFLCGRAWSPYGRGQRNGCGLRGFGSNRWPRSGPGRSRGAPRSAEDRRSVGRKTPAALLATHRRCRRDPRDRPRRGGWLWSSLEVRAKHDHLAAAAIRTLLRHDRDGGTGPRKRRGAADVARQEPEAPRAPRQRQSGSRRSHERDKPKVDERADRPDNRFHVAQRSRRARLRAATDGSFSRFSPRIFGRPATVNCELQQGHAARLSLDRTRVRRQRAAYWRHLKHRQLTTKSLLQFRGNFVSRFAHCSVVSQPAKLSLVRTQSAPWRFLAQVRGTRDAVGAEHRSSA